MAQVILNVEKDRSTGSSNARRARNNGIIPGVLYGKGIEPESISIAAKDLRDALSTDAGHNVLLELRIDDKSHSAIIKEVQVHKVKRNVTHVDIMVVSTDQEITAVVPLSLVGEPHELTRAGGRLTQTLREVTVKAVATKIPNAVEYDITHMHVGDHIKVADIIEIEGVVIETEPDIIVAVGELPRGAVATESAEQPPAN
jgi:large subunit ribosomal protein L25